MDVSRMRMLERVLQGVVDRHLPFDMSIWVDEDSTTDKIYDCGTAACAAGWLCRDQEAQAEGLYLECDPEEGTAYPAYDPLPPYLGTARGFRAMAAFLGLTDVDSQVLFDPMHYDPACRGPEHVLRRVREMVEAHRARKA